MIILDGLAFRTRYGAVLAGYAKDTARVALSLKKRIGGVRRALVVSAYPDKPDQSTLWWYDQGILVLLAAAGIELVYATDAIYELDDFRLAEVDARLRRIRLDEVVKLEGPFDLVVAMTPSDVALEASERFRAPLVAIGVKEVGASGVLTRRPPAGTVLWHGFFQDPNYVSACENQLGAGFKNWKLRGAPFPANRYYFPASGRKPSVDAILLGSKDRDIPLAFRALAKAGVRRIATVVDPDDTERIQTLAREHGLEAEVHPPLKHVHLLRTLESARILVNPIQSKSHYSFIAPLALGVPVVAMESGNSRVFVHGEHPAVLLAPPGDVEAWTERIGTLLDPGERARRSSAAIEQIRTRHDLDRFLASAMIETLGA